MNWDERELSGQGSSDLVSKIDALIEQQKRTWPLLARGYSALEGIETKPLIVDRSEVFAQHNPGRIKSTSASVDKESVEKRSCFLCAENLPPEEKAIRYGDNLMIMCNPFPILDRHLSIVHRAHVPQQIDGNVELLLSLSKDLAGRFFVLFNGAQCGASAPDHLHFQACSRKLLPVEADLGRFDSSGESEWKSARLAGVAVSALSDCGRNVIVFRGSDEQAMARAIYSILGLLWQKTARPEPMINLVMTGDKEGDVFSWTAYLFPRSRHRPSCFFAEGEDRMMVSPGAIDMAGVIVVPDASDFRRIDAEQVRRIYREVTLEDHIMREIMSTAATGAGREDYK